LEQRGLLGALDEKIDLLAHHFLQAGEYKQAVAYLARATRRARELCAYQAARNYVDLALAVVERLIQAASNERERGHWQNQRKDLEAHRAKLEAAASQTTDQDN
jgi:hypothetical protein